jgi:hypothetical protein
MRATALHSTLTALFGLLLVSTAVAGAAPTEPASPRADVAAGAVQPEGCDREPTDRFDDPETTATYLAGLGNDSAADWTAGEVLRIGADGECSLAVTGNRSATLTAAQVNGTTGVVHATVDVGRDGAFRTVAGANGSTNATNATVARSIAIENVGRENSARVAIVARNATGVIARDSTTAPSGRFFDVVLRWEPDGTVRVALREAGTPDPEVDEWDATVTTARNASWQLRLDPRAYLDRVAIGTRGTGDDGGSSDADPMDDDPAGPDFGDHPPEYSDYGSTGGGDGTSGGLLLGPVVALVGGGMYRFAYGVSRVNEQLDAIGSTTPSSEVEPAEWRVMLTKFVGAMVALGGVAWFLVALAEALA